MSGQRIENPLRVMLAVGSSLIGVAGVVYLPHALARGGAAWLVVILALLSATVGGFTAYIGGNSKADPDPPE